MPAAKRTPKRKSVKKDARPEGLLDTAAALSSRAALGALRLVARHPALSTGIAVFVVTASSVTVNALFEQHGRHQNPMLATRLVANTPAPERFGSLAPGGEVASSQTDGAAPSTQARTASVSPQPAKDPAPQVGAAERSRFSSVPAPATRPVERPDPENTASIAPNGRVASQAPTPDGRPSATAGGKYASLAEAERVKKIQAALSSAQVADLTVDGILGEQTKAAIRTFEALEGMDVTGRPEPRVLERLAEIGLVD